MKHKCIKTAVLITGLQQSQCLVVVLPVADH